MFHAVLIELTSMNLSATPAEIAEAIAVAREFGHDGDDACEHAVAALRLLAENGLLRVGAPEHPAPRQLLQ